MLLPLIRTNLKKYLTLLLGGLFLLIPALLFLNPEVKIYLIILIATILAVHLISYFLTESIFILVALSPFINWQIYLTPQISAPPADLLGLLILLGWFWKLIRTDSEQQLFQTLKKTIWPNFGLFALFLIIAALSASFGFFAQEGIKYLFRFIILNYLVYLVLITNLITNHRDFIKIIKIYFNVCLVIAALSFLQYLYNFNLQTIPRIIPFFLNNFVPLGINHNLLMELLIPAIPLGVILIKLNNYNSPLKKRLLFSVGFMVVVVILTLSRAGWLSLVLLAALTLILLLTEAKHQFNLKKRLRDAYKKLAKPISFILLIAIAGIILFLKSPEIISSNTNRLMQWQIGFDALSLSPYLGAGPGSFMEIINRDPFFVREFGGNLDAHGWILKILTETGILGLITFIAFLLGFFIKKIISFIKTKPISCKIILGYAVISGAAAIFLQLFTTSYFTPKMWLPLGILAAAQQIYGTKESEKN